MSVSIYTKKLWTAIVRIALLASLVLSVASLQAAPSIKDGNEQDAICGVWYTNNNNSKIEIYKKDGLYFGKIIWLKDPAKAAFTNKLVILDMAYNESRNIWDKGNLYNPMKDAQYQGILELFNKDTLSIRAFKGSPMFGKTFTWTRVK